MEKYKYKLQDNIFDEDNWNNYFIPIINEAIDEAISLIPSNLIADVDSHDIKRSWLFNNTDYEMLSKSEEQISMLRKKYAIIDTLDARGICNSIITELFGYTDGGIITKELIAENPEFYDFDWQTNILKNNYSSSWGIFNNNLIMNIASQRLDAYPAPNDTNGMLPFPITRKSLIFTKAVQDLNFQFLGVNSTNKKKSRIFENEQFCKYAWSWSDDVGLLMFFTPYFQEQFVRVNKYGVKPQFKITKIGSFIYSEYQLRYASTHYDDRLTEYKYLKSFISTKEYINATKKDIINFLKDKYDQLSIATIIPMINSEYQADLINKLKRDSILFDSTYNASNLLSYLVSENAILSDFSVMDSYNFIAYTNNAHEIITKGNNDCCIMNLYAIDSSIGNKHGKNSISTAQKLSSYWKYQELSLDDELAIIDECGRAHHKLGYLFVSKVKKGIRYYKSFIRYYSNLDDVSNFQLDLLYDELIQRYGIKNLSIDNGYLCFIMNSDVNDIDIDKIFNVVDKSKVK